MKTLICLMFFTCFFAHGAPVLNRNSGTTGNSITIWPDHKDPNQFYYAPTRMNISVDDNNKARLNVIDYTVGSCRWGRNCSRKILLSTYFESAYREEDLKNTKSKILSINPKANFVPVPFLSSQVVFGTTLLPFIDEHNCSPIGGQASDLVPCSIVLNHTGINRLLPRLANGGVLAFNFVYKIFGVVESATNSYRDFEAEYAIAVNLGGESMVGIPELQDYL